MRRPHAPKGEKEDLGDRKGGPIRKLASALGVELHVPLLAGVWHAGKVAEYVLSRHKKRKCNQAHDLRPPRPRASNGSNWVTRAQPRGALLSWARVSIPSKANDAPHSDSGELASSASRQPEDLPLKAPGAVYLKELTGNARERAKLQVSLN